MMRIMPFEKWLCVSLLCANTSVGLCAETPSEPWNLVKNGTAIKVIGSV
jgi:hypothetical protein